MKNLEKVEKILNILEFSKKFHHFSTFFSVCFHMNWLKIKYLSTEKTSKNPRNSAYPWTKISYEGTIYDAKHDDLKIFRKFW